MNDEMRTADQFMQAVYAMKKALDTDGLEKNLDLEIAARFNLRRKLRMIKSMQELYRYLHGNGQAPRILPSIAFDPNEGVERSNLHYFFKSMRASMPWDLPRNVLVVPTAATLLMVEIAQKLFPDKPVFEFTLLVERFINRWTLPKFRPEWTEKEYDFEVESYERDMLAMEAEFKAAYEKLSVYFGGLESPKKNPDRAAIHETNKNASKVAEKICGKDPAASFVAQGKALEIWKRYRQAPEVVVKYGKRHHRISYSDVFDFCKRQLVELGFANSSQFGKAVRAAVLRA